MSKVAINKCYGGFSISKECAKWIENKYGVNEVLISKLLGVLK